MADVEEWWERLEAHGYRRTAARRRLLVEIAGRRGPFTAAGIYAALHSRPPAVGRATVFRTVDLLAELGLLGRLGEEGGSGTGALYIACDSGHHHHLVCSRCNTVGDFVEGEIEVLLRTVAARHAFDLQAHRLELYGLCAACRGAIVPGANGGRNA